MSTKRKEVRRDLGEDRRELAHKLIEVGAVSPHVADPSLQFPLNLRTPDDPCPGPLTPEIVDLAARCMHKILKALGPVDAIVGIPPAGEPFARAIAMLPPRTLHIVPEIWEDGGRKHIVSLGRTPILVITKVLLVDALLEEGGLMCETVRVLRDARIEVADAMVVVDRGMGGSKELAKLGCHLHPIFTASELLELCAESNRISNQPPGGFHPRP